MKRHGMWCSRIDANPPLPPARQRNDRLVSERKVKLGGAVEESAMRFCLEYADGDQIAARREHSRRDRIDPGVLDPRAAADEGPVDVHRIHSLDLAERDEALPLRQRIGQSDLLAEPGYGRGHGNAESGEPSGKRYILPS